MAMLKHCFLCKKPLIIPSDEETYKLTDYDYVEVLVKFKTGNPYALIGEYCCKDCFDRIIFPHMFG